MTCQPRATSRRCRARDMPVGLRVLTLKWLGPSTSIAMHSPAPRYGPSSGAMHCAGVLPGSAQPHDPTPCAAVSGEVLHGSMRCVTPCQAHGRRGLPSAGSCRTEAGPVHHTSAPGQRWAGACRRNCWAACSLNRYICSSWLAACCRLSHRQGACLSARSWRTCRRSMGCDVRLQFHGQRRPMCQAAHAWPLQTGLPGS